MSLIKRGARYNKWTFCQQKVTKSPFIAVRRLESEDLFAGDKLNGTEGVYKTQVDIVLVAKYAVEVLAVFNPFLLVSHNIVYGHILDLLKHFAVHGLGKALVAAWPPS